VNLICDRALLAGYVNETRVINAAMVRQAANEVRGERSPGPLRWRHGLVAAALTLVLVLAFAIAPRRAQAPDVGMLEAPTSLLSLPTPTPAPPRSVRLEELVRALPREASFVSAAERVQAGWGVTRLARASLRTHLEQLRAFDLPAALELSHPARLDTCFAALLRLDERAAVVAIGGEPELEVPLPQLDGLWTQDAVVWWPQDEADAGGAGREAAQRALLGLGFAGQDLDAAVARFQQDTNLVADGRLGPRTRMAIFARSAQDRPRLSRGVERP
jgi:hypothetical protein